MTKTTLALFLLSLPALATGTGCGDASAPTAAVEDTCARITGCGLDGSMPIGFADCHRALLILRAVPDTQASRWQRDLAMVDCMFAADSCDQMGACLQATAEQAALCAGETSDVCSGNTLVACADASSSSGVGAYDCSKSGLVCAIGPNGDGTCGLGSCDPATAKPRCEGDLLVTCEDQYGASISEDCRLEGKRCLADATGMVACRSEAACDESVAHFRCEGSVEVHCEGGSESRQDCAMLGADWTCETKTYTSGDGSSTSSSMGCVPVAHDCELAAPESCASGVIGYCRAGHPSTYDCRRAGFSGCETKVSGTRTIAACVL